MSGKKGLTLIEIIVSMALLGIIALSFLTALSGNFSFLLKTKTITQDVFLAQKTLEEEIESIKAELDNDITPAGSKTDYVLFASVYAGNYMRTVSGYPREATIANNRKIITIIAETRMPVFTVPVAVSSTLVLRVNGTTLANNYEYVNTANLSLRATSTINGNGVFLVNKHEWFVSRAGFNIPMVSWDIVDKDYDLGRLYPLFPNDYIPIPIKSNSDQLSQSDFTNIISLYAGRHIIYTVTPYAISGKKGATIFSNPVFLSGPTVRDDLVLHLDASLISKEDAFSVDTVNGKLYVKKWENIVADENHAVQDTPSSMPELMEVQYPDDLYVWGKSTGGTGANMVIDSFKPNNMNDATLFIVTKGDADNPPAPGTDIIKGGNISHAWSFTWGSDNKLIFNAGETPAFLDEGIGFDDDWHVFTLLATDDILKIRIDGAEVGVAGDHDGSYSGSLRFFPFNINWDNLEIAEILVYDRDLSLNAGVDMLTIETYLHNKYYPNPTDINVSIVFLKPIAPITVYQNQVLVMPATVKALMSNGITQDIPVTWSDVIDTTVAGTQTSVATAVMDSTKTVVLSVTVVPIEVTGVELSESVLTLIRDNIHNLIAIVSPTDATNNNISWDSSDPSVASVNNDGLVTALEPGTAIITVTTQDGGFTATCTVTVQQRPEALSITSGYRDRFTLTFDKNIQSAACSISDTTETISGTQVTVTCSSDFSNNTDITVNVTSAEGSTNIVVVRRNGINWSIVSQQ